MHKTRKSMFGRMTAMFATLVLMLSMLAACGGPAAPSGSGTPGEELMSIPEYSGTPYYLVNGNQPFFTPDEITTEVFEEYSPLDSLGRCGVAYANICPELQPTEKRGDIGMIKPSGWVTARYDDLVEGEYLYNRSHLIGFQLAGENANKQNLITGTRYMNATGMLPFENLVDDYVDETGNHVLYRVTPLFEGDELVARGVLMEAYSVEDAGDGVCFNAYIYNVQPGVEIDYATGKSWRAETESQPSDNQTYVLNTNSKKFHLPSCSGAKNISADNRDEFTGDRALLIQQGYEPCGKCNP